MAVFHIVLSLCYKNNEWIRIPVPDKGNDSYCWKNQEIEILLNLTKCGADLDYELNYWSVHETNVILELEVREEADMYHVIPSNIFGDNHAHDTTKPGEFPMLTYLYENQKLCSPRIQIRADRASTPLAAICFDSGCVGISAEPYFQMDGEIIPNGLLAELPNRIGAVCGYINEPYTFVQKGEIKESKSIKSRKGKLKGRIYRRKGNGRQEIHGIVEADYWTRKREFIYTHSIEEAAEAVLKSLIQRNWSEEWKCYTNQRCQPPKQKKLIPWRPVTEIGWTGGAVLAFPLIMAEKVLKKSKAEFMGADTGEQIISKIIGGYMEESGMFADLMEEGQDSRVNGWWTAYGLVKDCHCAYTNASATANILRAILYLIQEGEAYPESWKTLALKVQKHALELQRDDGAFGYTFSARERKVLDWDGFAGCWFAVGALYAYELTGEQLYLDGAKRAVEYYKQYVFDLDCYGSPMDTWKAVDQEGNLAFIRAVRLLHQITGDERYLAYLEAGAGYEYLWRYGYQTRPLYVPLKDGWNSCGGSVTSVSNPHIHPMGLLANIDLYYLAEQTDNPYHKSRAEDGRNWLMNTLELYPDKTGYGTYGILSERFCPSDGLLIEKFSTGEGYSSWFSYNLWAAAAALETLLFELIIHNKKISITKWRI